jgi:DNA/RNA endonuclease G (NUC1)
MKKAFLAVAFLLFPTSAFASPCDHLFPNGKEIVVPDTVVLCNSFYATVYDPAREANVFSTEVATPRTGKPVRKNDFRPDKRDPDPTTPDDYTNTGYDRGHMVPAANSNDDKQMSETFFMTNMTPQEPTVNRTPWRLLEVAVRDMKFKYVVTGAIYENYNKVIGIRKVPVPTQLYKIVYLQDGNVIAYIADNVKGGKVTPTNVENIEAKVKFKFR